MEICWAVAGASGERGDEATGSAAELLVGASATTIVLGEFTDGYMPYVGADVKRWVHALADVEPDVVLVHHRDDLHQDHRFLAELALNAFRDHLILGYEIPKYDGDLGRPNVFVPLDRPTVDRKLALLERHFGSQRGKDWFDAETFRGLMRLRGVECRASHGYAEAYYSAKAVLGLGRGREEDRPTA